MIHFLLHITGGDNGSGPFYLELSGFIGLLGFVGAWWAWFKHSRCHINERPIGKNCWKHGRYPFQHYKLCKNHHPHVPTRVTHLHILQLHRSATDLGVVDKNKQKTKNLS